MILKHLALFATDMFLIMIVVLVLSRNFKGLLKLKVDVHNVAELYSYLFKLNLKLKLRELFTVSVEVLFLYTHINYCL